MSDPWAFGWAQLFDAVRTAAIAGGVYVGWLGLQKWRAEQLGKRRVELAEDILASYYEAIEVFRYIRNPVSFGGEGSTRVHGLDESQEKKKRLDAEFVTQEQINSQHDFFERVAQLRPRVRAVFGESVSEKFDLILKTRTNVALAAAFIPEIREEVNLANNDDERQRARDELKRYQSIKWRRGDSDEVETKLSDALVELESELLPMIRLCYRR